MKHLRVSRHKAQRNLGMWNLGLAISPEPDGHPFTRPEKSGENSIKRVSQAVTDDRVMDRVGFR